MMKEGNHEDFHLDHHPCIRSGMTINEKKTVNTGPTGNPAGTMNNEGDTLPHRCVRAAHAHALGAAPLPNSSTAVRERAVAS